MDGILATFRSPGVCITSTSVTKVLLSIHVLAAIIAIGPVTVAASMFPAAVRRGDLTTLRTLHRICRVYAALGVVVPVFGLATATSLGVLGDAWLLISIALTVVAAGVLALLVLPGQTAVMAQLGSATGSAGAGSAAPGRSDGGSATPSDGGPAGAGAGDVGLISGAPPVERQAAAARLGMTTGIFNLLWAVVVVLMIVRPGSTTGA